LLIIFVLIEIKVARALTGRYGTIRVAHDLVTRFEAVVMEVIATGILCLTALHTASEQQKNSFYGLAIGLSVFVSIMTVGGYSGAGLNPALGTALPLLQLAEENPEHGYAAKELERD